MVFKRILVFVVCALSACSLGWGSTSQTSFKFKPVVHAGDAAPVPPQLSSVLEFAFNDQGQVAVIGDGGLILKSGSQVTPIAAQGDPAPGGSFFFSVDAPSLSPQGQLVFRGNVAFPGTSGLYSFSNGTLSLFMADGTLATDGESVTPQGAAFAGNGDMLVDSGGALFLFSNGALTRLVGPGDTAPDGSTFSFLNGGVINQSGQVAFEAFLSTGGNGIFLLSGGTITKIIASGDIMPDGVPFGFADQPSLNDSGQVVFGGISNSIADSGIFSFSNGQLSVAIPRLALLPDGSFFSVPFTTSVNDAGEIAFSAANESFNNGVFSSSNGVFLFANGQINELEIAGQQAPDGGTFKSGVEVGAAINASGQVLFLADRFQHGNALYLFSSNQLSRVIGQGDTIPRDPTFEFPAALAIGGSDRVLISDSTFPGGNGSYTATPFHGKHPGKQDLAVHVGEAIGVDGVVDFLFGSAMNHGGTVAASVSSSDAFGTLLQSSDDLLSVLLDSEPASTVDPNGSTPAINDNGDIAFNGFSPATQTSGVFLFSNGQPQLLLSAGTQLPDGTFLNNITNLALNNQETLAFMASPVFPNTSFFLFSNGQLSTLATNGSPAPGGGTFQIFFASPRLGPVINNRGDVAFASSLAGTAGGFFGSGGVFLFKEGTLTRIVGPNDPSPDGGVFLFADSPSINSRGDVAFFAETSAFNFGVFVSRDGQITQVAVAGDFVNGEGLGFADQPVLNHDGHVGFTATLFDGRNAIFVAAEKHSDDSDAAEWAESTSGAPISTGAVEWQKTKNNLQSNRAHHHVGMNVRATNQSAH